ncbi:histidine kinase [Alloacidobacterium sp.]|uniref:histidine kinase n=1 Tax=Alloacidobacterium sp. TaxID=2951999 RepID=UPI002D64346E|nr:histidine kinase [Alloacidobacterium sp.]HYK35592.1 histidine kinase [Alloacidobacterium sp.]
MRLSKGVVLYCAGVGMLIAAAFALYMRSPWRGLPYGDSFASTRTDEWTPYSGNWTIVDGAIKNDSSDRGAKFVTGSPYWKNYSVEANMQLVANGGDAGLMIRVSGAERGVDSYNGYYAGLRTSDQSLVLGRAEHGWIEFPPVKMPGGVLPGKWYHLKLSAFGCSISASATDIETGAATTVEAHDPHCFASGRIGLRSMAAGGVWRNIRAERISSADAARLAAAPPPAETAIYPTSQGTPAFASVPNPAPPVVERAHNEGLTQPIRNLHLFSISHPARVTVRGSVIDTEPLFIQDSSGGVEVELKNKVPLRVGDEVEVEGDVYPHGLTATIGNAIARPLGGLTPPPPLSVTADQAATGAYHAMYIEVEGTLHSKTDAPDGLLNLELRDGQQVFRALASSAATETAFRRLEKGSVVRVRGICFIDADHTKNAVPFVVLVSSADDVRMLVGPPWWSAGHLIELALLMLVLGFIVHLLFSRAEEWRLRAVIDERERLAHEIHDTLAQSFAGIGFQLRAILNRISRHPSPLDKSMLIEELNRTSDLVRHSHDEARRSIITLRPDATEAGGLVAALEQVARQMVGRVPVEVESSVEGEPRTIPLHILDCLFRIGQEAIANAMQHGHPTRLLVRAVYAPSTITLIVEDNGAGFVPRPDADGFGLTGIHRRAESIQGTVEIETGPGRGTRISVRAPAVLKRARFFRLAYDEEQREPSSRVS